MLRKYNKNIAIVGQILKLVCKIVYYEIVKNLHQLLINVILNNNIYEMVQVKF